MRRALILGVAAALACSAPAAAKPKGADAGAEIARRNCGMCHAIGRAGQSPNPAAPPFRELGARYPLENLQEALAEGILTGHPAMPEFRFSPAQIDQLILYMKTIQVRDRAANARPSLRAG
jgi:mono/diheme cytochrome c family protein